MYTACTSYAHVCNTHVHVLNVKQYTQPHTQISILYYGYKYKYDMQRWDLNTKTMLGIYNVEDICLDGRASSYSSVHNIEAKKIHTHTHTSMHVCTVFILAQLLHRYIHVRTLIHRPIHSSARERPRRELD